MIRNLDEVARVVIPKEMRKQLGIKEGDPVNIECDGNKVIITKPDTVDYKAIVEEAIKYIKEYGCYEEDMKVFCDDIDNYNLPRLLDILNGKKD